MAERFSPIKAPKAATIVADDLRAQVISRQVLPGDRLPSEATMIEQYRVSRPTLREALRVLEIEGLIEISRGINGGPRVLQPSMTSIIQQAYTLLSIAEIGADDVMSGLVEIEVGALGIICADPSEETADELLRLEGGARPSIEPWPGAAQDWHAGLVRLAGSTLNLAHATLVGVLAGMAVSYCTRPADDEDHRAISAAARAGDLTAAISRLRQHHQARDAR